MVLGRDKQLNKHSQQVTVQCAIFQSLFFEEEGGCTVTVNVEWYTEMIRFFFKKEKQLHRDKTLTKFCSNKMELQPIL